MTKRSLPRPQWRSLRVQVLLWTALPLTIFLIAFSLTGIGTHQTSMRSLAGEEAQRLAGAVATSISLQFASYHVGLEAAAGLIAHHAGDATMRDFHLSETSAVMGDVELVLFDSSGQPLAAAGNTLPEWAAGGSTLVSTTAQMVRNGESVFVRADLPDGKGTLIARVPLQSLAFVSYLGGSPDLYGTTLELLDGNGALMLAAGPAAAENSGSDEGLHTAAEHEVVDDATVAASATVPGTDWTVRMRESWHTRTVPLLRFEQAMPFVLVVAAAVSFLTLFFGLRLVVQPLRSLATSAQRIGTGDFDAASDPVGGVDEIENVRSALNHMAGQIRTHQRALEQHLHAVTRAQEDERARLARELHDETVQGLIALDHRLQKAQRTLGRDPSLLKDEVTELRQMVRGEMEEVRRFSRALRPVYLEDLGLCPALDLLSHEQGVTYTMTGEQRRLDPAVELALYRIAQESINNARRHAQARQIDVQLDFTPSSVTIVVKDDGIGFAPPPHLGSLSREGHFGLMGIQERADLIGAQLSIDSAPGKGTTVTVSVGA